MDAIRADKQKDKDEQIARVKNGTHMLHGVDLTVWTESTFAEVIGNLVAWRRSNPSVLPKVFPPGLLHPSDWPGYAKAQPEF
jgi:hypothetical protein